MAPAPRTESNRSRKTFVQVTLVGLLLIGVPGFAAAAGPCEVVATGGTIELPPQGCEYLSPSEVHLIINGLPPSPPTTIELAPIHKDFICNGYYYYGCTVTPPPGFCETPGGTLGGSADCFGSVVELQIDGTGALAGFSRLITVQLEVDIHTAPRTPGDPVQDFDTEMIALSGALPGGDPDFCVLDIKAGTGNGLPPSPGHTTLTEIPGGKFAVDSFFDITYQITFQGCPGSMLDGMSGSTQSTLRMRTGVPAGVPVPSVAPWGVGALGALLFAGALYGVRRAKS